MIGIVLVTHGRLAAEFRAALEHVVGPQKQVESIAIGPDDDIEQRRQEIISAASKVDSGSGVVVLTDMFGGTPCNLALSIMNGSNIEVIAGVNLAMLIKFAAVRETSSLEQAVIQAKEAGRKYIYVASQFLAPDSRSEPGRAGETVGRHRSREDHPAGSKRRTERPGPIVPRHRRAYEDNVLF
jgi:PTS system mannose-specific IIA component